MVFLIIFGTRGVTSSVASGQFHCPGCTKKRSYVHKRVRRFFTLYFIPIIPLDTIGEIVAAPGRALVTRGIYAWFRHPSEIGLFFVALGVACLGASAAALGVVLTVLAPSILIRVAREDRALGR